MFCHCPDVHLVTLLHHNCQLSDLSSRSLFRRCVAGYCALSLIDATSGPNQLQGVEARQDEGNNYISTRRQESHWSKDRRFVCAIRKDLLLLNKIDHYL